MPLNRAIFKKLKKSIRTALKFGIRTIKMLRFIFARYFRAIKNEPHAKFENFLSIAAIAKNEGEYFKEWIEYHRLVGVEKFYIYDNESNDDTVKILAPYIKSGLVEYIWFPGNKMQWPTYRDAVVRSRNKTKWLAVVDLDEFIVPISTKTIPEFLSKLPDKVRQLSIGCLVYGSNGHIRKPKGLVIENYKRRAPEQFEYKSIVNPRFVYYIRSCHCFRVFGKYADENMNYIKVARNQSLSCDKMRVNHYRMKSIEDALAKAKKGDAVKGNAHIKYTKEFINKNDKNDNAVYDDIMDKYIPLLKQKHNI